MRPFPPLAAVVLLMACTDPALDNGQQNTDAQANASSGPADFGDGDMAAPIPDNRSGTGSEIETGPNRRSPPMNPEADAGKAADGADQCDAGKYQYLIGQSRSKIPSGAGGPGTRVTCTSCPLTMDYSPSRLNILYDEKTEIVKEVKCG